MLKFKQFISNWKKEIIWILNPLLFLIVFQIVKRHKAFMNFVVNHITSPFKWGVSWFCNLFPFSVAEVVWTLAILIGLFYLVRVVWCFFFSSREQYKLIPLTKRLLHFLSFVLIIYCGYTLFWGANYYCDSFSEKAGLVDRGATVQELYELSLQYAQLANTYSEHVSRNADGICNENKQEIFSRASGIYTNIEKTFPALKAPERTPKGMLESRLISYIGFTGFFFPFTGEANLNTDSPVCLLPATIAHELAHQRGVASEQEANFVAIMTGLNSNDSAYQYSAALLGYIHLTNALYSANPDLWKEVYNTLNEKVRADLTDNNAYWNSFQKTTAGKAAQKVSDQVYTDFLESYDQDLGLKSYEACVDLLVAYYYAMSFS